MPIIIKVNNFIEIRYNINQEIEIYINKRLFTQCKSLVIQGSADELLHDELDSIDEYKDFESKILIPADIEFWGHCSNLQAWAENDYDTRILTAELAFPMLKRLTEIGDPIARRVFKEEIGKRYSSGYENVRTFLEQEGYLNFLDNDELSAL